MRFSLALASLAACLASSSLALAQTWGQPGAQPGWNNGPPPSGQTQTQPGGMNAGGLAPPSSGNNAYGEPSSNGSPTEQELQTAEKEDSGRGLEFVWLNAEAGGEHLGLQTFKANNLVDAGVVKTTQTGFMYGAGLGVRLVFLTLGARFRMGNFSEYQLWTLNGEVGLHIPLGAIEPYFTLGGGYASMGSFNQSDLAKGLGGGDVSVKGYDIRGGFGIDFYLSNTFTLGANLTGEMLALTRPGVDPNKLKNSTPSAQEIYQADGSSIGAAVALTAVAGLHF